MLKRVPSFDRVSTRVMVSGGQVDNSMSTSCAMACVQMSSSGSLDTREPGHYGFIRELVLNLTMQAAAGAVIQVNIRHTS